MSPCKDKPEQNSEAEAQRQKRLKYFHYLNRAEIRKNGQAIGNTAGNTQDTGEDISTPADLTTTSESKTDPR
jgi:hypothetical protein